MKFLSLAVAIALASSHLAEAHDVRTKRKLQRHHERSHTKPRTHHAAVRTGSKATGSRAKPDKREHTVHKRMDDGPSLIVGGTGTSVNEFPYYVDMDGCGGSLIAPGVVLTAAHCEPEGFSYVGERVIVGGTHRQQVTNEAQVANVVKSISHPQYDSSTMYQDVMLMKLDSAITTTGSVNLSLNSNENLPSNGQTLTVIGTGNTAEGGTQSDDLLQVNVPAVDTATCNGPYEDRVLDEVMFCAGGVGGQDSCQGDSGGPIVVQTGNSHSQVGVVSWGDGCARQDVPGVYARVSSAMNFIAYVTCNCFGVNEANICAYYDQNDNFSCDQNAGGGSGGGDDGGDGGGDGEGEGEGGSGPSGCEKIAGWVDDFGDGCGWYEENDDEGCPNTGGMTGTGGAAASEACCHCDGGGDGGGGGGGDGDGGEGEGGSGPSGCEKIAGWVDDYGDGCGWYEENDDEGCPNTGEFTGTGGATASEACCHCDDAPAGGGGGDGGSGSCDDYANWEDNEYGDGCDFYANDEICDDFGTDVGTDGLTASEACTGCGACH